MLSELQHPDCCQQQQQQHLHDIPAEQQQPEIERGQHQTTTSEGDALRSSGLPTMGEVRSSSSSRSTTKARKSRRLISPMNFMMVWLIQMVLLLSSCSKQPSVGFFVDAARDKTLSANEMAKYWIDAGDVLDQLDNYQALWIKVHGCV